MTPPAAPPAPKVTWAQRFAEHRKTVTALVYSAIAFVVAQESLPHPFTGHWWVGALTGAGVVLGVYGVPNATRSQS